MIDKRIGQGPCDFLRPIDIGQRHDLAQVQPPGELALGQVPIVALGLGTESEEALEEVLLVGPTFAFQNRLGVLRVFDVLTPVIGTQMLGDKFFPVVEAEPFGVELEQELRPASAGAE